MEIDFFYKKVSLLGQYDKVLQILCKNSKNSFSSFLKKINGIGVVFYRLVTGLTSIYCFRVLFVYYLS